MKEITPFGICYVKLEPDQVEPYNLVVVEPDFYSAEEVKNLKSKGTKIIAYTTLGEVDPNRNYFADLEKYGFLGENPLWNSYYLDLNKKEVRDFIINNVIQGIMSKGFDGLFLDTVDAVSPETERGDLQPFMSAMIQNIRELYPQKIIIQNAGLFLLNETSTYIDAFLTESLASTFDFETQEYVIRPVGEFKERLGYLQYYVDQFDVPYLILDYADSDRHYQQIKTRLDTLGHPYFVSNIALSKLPSNADSVANKLGGD
ncbi:MAG: endo alpha-1,4 polygalactosaminidase [Gracilimonas sp.]|nr:endo alpha-1,4 polygalactosaminidase [Gracilimonas sp.]